MVPFYTVERSGFKEMIKTLDARYEPPSRKYFSETEMPKLYSEFRDKVEKDLRLLKYFSTTTVESHHGALLFRILLLFLSSYRRRKNALFWITKPFQCFYYFAL